AIRNRRHSIPEAPATPALPVGNVMSVLHHVRRTPANTQPDPPPTAPTVPAARTRTSGRIAEPVHDVPCRPVSGRLPCRVATRGGLADWSGRTGQPYLRDRQPHDHVGTRRGAADPYVAA